MLNTNLIVILSLSTALLTLAACNSSSDDEGTPSPNIAATQTLLDEARLSWQKTNLSNYAYSVLYTPGACDDGIVVDPAPAYLHRVTDSTYSYSIVEPFFAMGEEFEWARGQLQSQGEYDSLYDNLQNILDSNPTILGRSGNQASELPAFDDRGVLTHWFHKGAESGCEHLLTTATLVDLENVNYDFDDTFEALEDAYVTWRNAGISSYSYDIQFTDGTCEAPQESEVISIRVEDGEVVEHNWPEEHPPGWVNGIEQSPLFYLGMALQRGPYILQAGREDSAAIEFEPNFGFPYGFYAEYQYRSRNGDLICNALGMRIETFE